MAKWKGDKISLEIYGESHAEKIGVYVSGLDATNVDKEKLTAFTNRRKASNMPWSTPRIESDEPVFTFYENGDFRAEIFNSNVKSKDYNFIVAKKLANPVLGDDYEVLETYKGKDLEYKEYEQLLPFINVDKSYNELQ